MTPSYGRSRGAGRESKSMQVVKADCDGRQDFRTYILAEVEMGNTALSGDDTRCMS